LMRIEGRWVKVVLLANDALQMLERSHALKAPVVWCREVELPPLARPFP
jgi:hypothetical protein